MINKQGMLAFVWENEENWIERVLWYGEIYTKFPFKFRKLKVNILFQILRGILKPSELRLLEKQKKNVESETVLNEIREIDETESRDAQAIQNWINIVWSQCCEEWKSIVVEQKY